MKIRFITSIGCLFLMAGLLKANAILGFNDGNTGDMGPAAGTYLAGQSFTFDITLSVTSSGSDPLINVSGLSYWFETSAINNSYFTITNRNLTGSPFSNPNTPGLTYPQAIVAGGNADDLGATGPLQASNTSYFVASLTIKINPLTPPGTYTIFTTTFNSNTNHSKTSEVFDQNAPHLLPAAFYTITVVPEPGTLSLLGLGGLASIGLAFWRARWRHMN